jgi:serine/threonine protein kinase
MSKSRPSFSWVGHIISNRYKIEALLGQGGMSAVYKAIDPNLKRPVAVKLIHPHLSSNPEFVRRFEQEAAAVAQLRHPNIIQVFDFNHDDDFYYMVLEYLPGETLQKKMADLQMIEQRFSMDETVSIMSTICDAVHYAHQQNMVHRDLKPANVMLTPQKQPILMDFGVAKMLGGSQHTATGAIIGTAKYMSPEQARGERPDERTDIYSLGVMLYEMVGGQAPFDGDTTIAVLMKHVSQPVPDIRQLRSDIPDWLVAIIEKALAKKQQDRFQSAAEMAATLRGEAVDRPYLPPVRTVAIADKTELDIEIPQTPPPPPMPPPPIRPAVKNKSTNWLLWGVGGVTVLLVLFVGIIAALIFAGSGDGTAEANQPTSEPVPTQAAVAPSTDTPEPPRSTAVVIIEEIPTDTPTLPPPTHTPTVSPPASDTLAIPTATPTATEAAAPTATPTSPPPPTAVAPQNTILIPPGTFLMGSAAGMPNEAPEHTVSISAFFIDKFEVSNADYRQCVAAGGCTPAATVDAFTYAGYRDDPAFNDYPVISVTWNQAQAYCRWAGKRLPTEAEWEYAARGSDNFIWSWGNNFDPALSAASAPDTQPVNSYPGGVSPFGLFNMTGNVNEWVQDVYDAGFYAVSPAENPVNAGSGENRVYRGGSFDNTDGSFYTTSRRYDKPATYADVDVGFRCAQDTGQ